MNETNMNAAALGDEALEQAVGGKQDKNDYIYEATVCRETYFLKAISLTPENYKVWITLYPGVRIRVREEGLIDWVGKTYVRCIAKVDTIEEGYVLQDYIVRKTV